MVMMASVAIIAVLAWVDFIEGKLTRPTFAHANTSLFRLLYRRSRNISEACSTLRAAKGLHLNGNDLDRHWERIKNST